MDSIASSKHESSIKSDRKSQLLVEIELKSKLNSIQRTEKNKQIKEIQERMAI